MQALRDAETAGEASPVREVRQLWLAPVVLEKSDPAQIEAPVLVVSGDRDVIRLEPVEMFESLPNAQLCILPGTGHDTFQTAATR